MVKLTPGSRAEVDVSGRCQFTESGDERLIGAQHMHNDLFISRRTLSLCPGPRLLSQSPPCVCRLTRTHPSGAHVLRIIQVSERSVFCRGGLMGRGEGMEGRGGRQRGRVLGESGEGGCG